jgi:mannose-6-phosphate isomerase-like protein (cupin superfamily)
LKIELRNKVLSLKSGELVVIPKGVEHKPIAEFEVSIMLIEPKSTLSTGDSRDIGDKMATCGDWI